MSIAAPAASSQPPGCLSLRVRISKGDKNCTCMNALSRRQSRYTQVNSAANAATQ